MAKGLPADLDARLIGYLTLALGITLADAIEVGVESNSLLSISDIDVPSVAAHEQNAYREGFQPIVRITAELWSRLIKKDADKALNILQLWTDNDDRLIHRLALYAAADPSVPWQGAADMLMLVPSGELFLTNSQVEVHRLLRARWSEFSPEAQRAIEARIVEGPPADLIAKSDDPGRLQDRVRFELLLDLERHGALLGPEASSLLAAIRERHPQWHGREPERAGFAMWHGPVTSVVGDKENLTSTPDHLLIQTARKLAAEASPMEGDSWQGLCQAEPLRAFQGIEAAAEGDRWHEWAWRPML
jgi:hypothetical protein